LLASSAICAGFKGVPISEQEEVRRTAMDSMKQILTAAGALGSIGMIMVPAFSNQTKLGDQESRERYPAEEFRSRVTGPCEVEIVANCDHFYNGCEDTVATLVSAWLARTLKAPPA
jgi:hypothetical protein